MPAMERLNKLYLKKFGKIPDEIRPLRSDGSDRKIYRVFSGNHSVIGILGSNREENEAFLAFSKHFIKYGLSVPEIYAEDIDAGAYLEEDLGDATLFTWMSDLRSKQGFNDEIKKMYQAVVTTLPQFQIIAGTSLDYSYCYQHIAFARESMSWDLHYFKHRFLNYYYKKRVDHTKLEQDFNTLIDFLLEEETKFFLYRDFQSRNVMIKNNRPHFIDYQSGRKGALQYDLASILFDAKADLPQDFRDEMVEAYIKTTQQIIDLDAARFKKYYYGFVCIRIMQAFGAYGYLSAVLGKTHFLKSVPYAIKNLEILIDKNVEIVNQLPTLKNIFLNLIDDKSLRNIEVDKSLIVRIYSFGFHKSGIPIDSTNNNGGFVFDCRFLPNPGREEKFKTLTGKDKDVIDYLEREPSVAEFLDHVFKIVAKAVENYRSRDFTDLMVSFGCTGGQHRSIYCAEKLVEYLKQKNIVTQIKHTEFEKK